MTVSKNDSFARAIPAAASPAANRPVNRWTRPGDAPQAVRTVPRRVHSRDDGQQCLSRADIGRRSLPADVLLPGLECETVGGLSERVGRDADEPPGQRPHVVLERRDVGGMGTAETERHAEPLTRSDRDVRSERAGRFEQDECQEIGCDHGQCPGRPRLCRDRAQIHDRPVGIGVLDEHTAGDLGVELIERADDELDAEWLGTSLENCEGLGMDPIGGEEHRPFPPVDAVRHCHRLGRGRRLIEQ